MSVGVLCWTGATGEIPRMIRDLFIAVVVLIVTVAATAWLNGATHMSVEQVEASVAR
jgi:hypothetical protein